METKDYFKGYIRCRKLIKKKQEEIAAVEDLCEHITSNYETERVQSSGDKDKLGNLAARKADLINEKIALVNEALDYLTNVEEMINSVEDVDAQLILQARYIRGETWREIADKYYYGKSTVQDKANKAIRSISKSKENPTNLDT